MMPRLGPLCGPKFQRRRTNCRGRVNLPALATTPGTSAAPGVRRSARRSRPERHGLVAPDDPACRTDDLAHARVEIGVIEPRTKLPPQALLELLVDRVDWGSPRVATNAPISRVPGKSTPSPNAPPSTAKPTPRPSATKRSRKPRRAASSMPGSGPTRVSVHAARPAARPPVAGTRNC